MKTLLVTAALLLTIGAAAQTYRSQLVAHAQIRQTVDSVPVWSPGEGRPFTDADAPLMQRWGEIMSPTAASNGDDWALARAASYCLMKEQMLRQQQLRPGETLAQQPCRTLLLATDPTYTKAERCQRLQWFIQTMGSDAIPQGLGAIAN